MSAVEEKVAKMDWQDVRTVLKKSEPQTRAAGEKTDPQEELLRSYFGDERFRDLRELAKRGDAIRKGTRQRRSASRHNGFAFNGCRTEQ